MKKIKEERERRKGENENVRSKTKRNNVKETLKRKEKTSGSSSVSFKRRRTEQYVINSDEDNDEYVTRRPAGLPSSTFHPRQRLKNALCLERMAGRTDRSEKERTKPFNSSWKGTPFKHV